MTGMEVEWHYNGTVIPDVKYLEYNKNFIRIVNIIHYLEINNTSRLWEKVRTVRFNWMMKRGVEGEDEDEPFYANINQVKTAVTADHLDEIEKSLDMGQKVPTVPISGDVADDVLAEAVEMYIYLIDYPSARLIAWIRIYSNFLKKSHSDLRHVLSTVADIAANQEDIRASQIAERILLRWSEILNLTNIDIQTLMLAPSKLKTTDLLSRNNTSISETSGKGKANLHNPLYS